MNPAFGGAGSALLNSKDRRMSSLEFARPLWLAAGVLACALMLWGMFRADRRRTADLSRLVHPRFHARLLPALSPALQWWKRALWLLAVMLLCTAAAGPQAGYEMREIKRRGIDLLFAIDTSRSMLAEDLSPNRLERARMGIHDFLDRLEGDRVGLVPFAGSAYPLCPLTVDYDAFRESLDALDTEIIPKAGTDVAAAIRESHKLLESQQSNHRILVLITDGEDFEGDVEDAISEAKEKGMTIHTIGVGSTEGVRIPMKYPDGRMDYVRDGNGQPVLTKLDERTLQDVAEKTGGLYAPLGRRAEGLDTIYQEKLRLVPKNELGSKHEKVPLLRYEWPLGAALLLLLMNFLLPDRRREVKARALPSAARRKPAPGAAVMLAAGAVLLYSPGAARAQQQDARVDYNKGTEAYDSGDFTTAEVRLRAALKSPDLSLQNRAYYNLGNALYRLGQSPEAPEDMKTKWEEAIKAYDGALALNPADADAKYNRDLVQRKLDELNKQKDQKDQKDDQKDGEKKEDEEKKDQQKDGQKQDGEKKDGGEKKEGGKKDHGEQSGEEKQGEEKKEGEEKSGDGKKDEEKKEGAEKSGGEKQGEEKKEGEEKPAEEKQGEEKKDGEKKDGVEAKQQSAAEERRDANEMNAEEARRLLKALRQEERMVIPIDQPPPQQRRMQDRNNTTKGKTW
jgi:Ca-activated chloride channel homolog